MFKPGLTALLLICALAISACATNSPQPPVSCPVPPPPPAAIMQERQPDFGKRLRAILFGSPTSATPSSSN